MYGVNASIPKTLVRGILESYAEHHEGLKDVLLDICDTPVSPELLPPNEDGTIKQKTDIADLDNIKLGSKIHHPKFGTGTVVAVKGPDITIAFDNQGIKTINKEYTTIDVIK